MSASAPVMHVVFTLDGNAQQLKTSDAINFPIRAISIQPGGANASPVYIGGAAVSATVYGVSLPASAAGVPPAPFLIDGLQGGAIQLGDFYVIGAVGEKVTLLIFPYI